MRVLVAGGAGFMGSAFVRNFALGKFPKISSILIVDALTYAHNFESIEKLIDDKRIEFIQADIRDNLKMDEAMLGIDVCVNYAAETHVDNSITNPDIFFQTNIIGTSNLLSAGKKAEIKKFIQISTDEVYGEINEGEWTESSSLDPSSPYSASKLSADLIAKAFHKTYNFPITITRSCNNYGPGQNIEKLIPKTFTAITNQEPIPIYGSGKNIREWMYVDDHARGTYDAMVSGKSGEIYNIGSGVRIANIDLVRRIIQLAGGSESLIEFVEDRKGHDFRYALDSSKANSELGFMPEIDLATGLLATHNWYKKRDQTAGSR